MPGNKWSPGIELVSTWSTIEKALRNPKQFSLQVAPKSEAKSEITFKLKVAFNDSKEADSTLSVTHSIIGRRHSFNWKLDGCTDAFSKIMDVMACIESKKLNKI